MCESCGDAFCNGPSCVENLLVTCKHCKVILCLGCAGNETPDGDYKDAEFTLDYMCHPGKCVVLKNSDDENYYESDEDARPAKKIQKI